MPPPTAKPLMRAGRYSLNGFTAAARDVHAAPSAEVKTAPRVPAATYWVPSCRTALRSTTGVEGRLARTQFNPSAEVLIMPLNPTATNRPAAKTTSLKAPPKCPSRLHVIASVEVEIAPVKPTAT